jgi:Phage terminase large subunit
MSILKIPTAKVFEPLLSPARYKGLYGGRGSGKSHFFGELLVETCQAERGTLAVCIREAQRTLAQSSKRLIESKIAALGVGSRFKLFNDKIETPGDGLIIFRGMQDHTSESIKSLEGFGIAWIDEAQNLSARSLSLLRPTIRAENCGRRGIRVGGRMPSTISCEQGNRRARSSSTPTGATIRGFHPCWSRNASSISRFIPIATSTSGKAITSGRSRARISRSC